MVLPKLAAPMFVWRFAAAELDEAARELRVGGHNVDMAPRPLEVLLQLLRHAGEVVTKEDLLDAVYGHRHLSDGALAQAIRRLRHALQDDDQRIIATVHRVGYKLSAGVNRQEINAPRSRPLLLKAGDWVPMREHWKLVRTLGGSDVEVWLIEHDKTHAQRVLKLCTDPVRLSALKREVTLFRVLRETLGTRDDLVAIADWNFDHSPYFIECEYGGITLLEWAESNGGVAAIPLPERLRMIAGVAVGVAAAHSAQVLHKDLKPSNILAYQSAAPD
jgi:eukaryotic-like serine/threonine-protein kinase